MTAVFLVLVACSKSVESGDTHPPLVTDYETTCESATVGDVRVYGQIGDVYAYLTDAEWNYVCTLSECALSSVIVTELDELSGGSWTSEGVELFEMGRDGGSGFLAVQENPIDPKYYGTSFAVVWSDRRVRIFTDGDGDTSWTSSTLRSSEWFQACLDVWDDDQPDPGYSSVGNQAYDCLQLDSWIEEPCDGCVPSECPT